MKHFKDIKDIFYPFTWRKIHFFLTTLLIATLFFTACKYNGKKKEKEELIMHEPSEMALLMRQMYEYNKSLKLQLINGDSLAQYPEEFRKIHTAVLSNPEERDREYDSLAEVFLKFQSKTFSAEKDSSAYYFNQSVNACIACHKTRCTGPIPKIKRLKVQ